MWTCLKHVLVDNTDLMMDRHLDQILMCAVYVMAKVSNISASITGLDKLKQNILMCAVYVMAKVSNISASTTGLPYMGVANMSL